MAYLRYHKEATNSLHPSCSATSPMETEENVEQSEVRTVTWREDKGQQDRDRAQKEARRDRERRGMPREERRDRHRRERDQERERGDSRKQRDRGTGPIDQGTKTPSQTLAGTDQNLMTRPMD